MNHRASSTKSRRHLTDLDEEDIDNDIFNNQSDDIEADSDADSFLKKLPPPFTRKASVRSSAGGGAASSDKMPGSCRVVSTAKARLEDELESIGSLDELRVGGRKFRIAPGARRAASPDHSRDEDDDDDFMVGLGGLTDEETFSEIGEPVKPKSSRTSKSQLAGGSASGRSAAAAAYPPVSDRGSSASKRTAEHSRDSTSAHSRASGQKHQQPAQQLAVSSDRRSGVSVRFAQDVARSDEFNDDLESDLRLAAFPLAPEEEDEVPGAEFGRLEQRSRESQRQQQQQRQQQPQQQKAQLQQPQQQLQQPQQQLQQPQQQLQQPQQKKAQQQQMQLSVQLPELEVDESQRGGAYNDGHIAQLKDWGQRVRQCMFKSEMAMKEKETEIANKKDIIANLQEENAKLRRELEFTNVSYQSEKDGRTSIEKRINGLHHLCVSLRDSLVSIDLVVKSAKSAQCCSDGVLKRYQVGYRGISTSMQTLGKSLTTTQANWSEQYRQLQESSAQEADRARASYDELREELAGKCTLLEQSQAATREAEAACESLQLRAGDLATRLELLATQKEALVVELESARRLSEAAAEEGARKTAELRSLADAKLAVEAELSDAMIAHQSQVEDLEGQLRECRLEISERNEKITSLKSDLDEGSCNLDEMSDNLSAMEAEVARQARELTSAKRESDLLRVQVDSLKTTQAESEALRLALVEHGERLRDKMLADEDNTDSLLAQMTEMSSLIDEARSDAHERQLLLDEQLDRNKMLNEELAKLREMKTSLDEKLDYLMCETASMRCEGDARVQKLELSVAELDRQLSEKSSEAVRLSDQLAALTAARAEAARQLAESAVAAEAAGRERARREAELEASARSHTERASAAEAQASTLATRTDSLARELDRTQATLAEAEARAAEAAKLSAALGQELAAANASVREKDARLDDLRQELGGLRDVLTQGSSSMRNEFATMLERLCEEKDRMLADREGQLMNLQERMLRFECPEAATSRATTPSRKTPPVTTAAAGESPRQPTQSPSPPSPTPVAPPVTSASVPKSPAASRVPAVRARSQSVTPNAAGAHVSAPVTPETPSNLKSPRGILRRQEPSTKRRKVHFDVGSGTVELRRSEPPAEQQAVTPKKQQAVTPKKQQAKRLALANLPSPQTGKAKEQPPSAVDSDAGSTGGGDGFWFDSDIIFG